MFTFLKNRIFKSLTMLCFVVLLVLIPLSPVFTPSPEGHLSVSITTNTTHAVAPWILWGLGSSIVATLANFSPAKILLTAIGNLVLSIASALTYLGGMLLESSLKYFVFDMGKVLQGDLGSTITTMWSLVRDICNLIFIFGLMYIGLRTIIDPENSSTKKTLTQIIIAALLINFSLFMVKVVIDFSNFLAFILYKTLAGDAGSIGASFAHALGIISFFNVPGTEELNRITGGGYLWFYFLAALLILIAAFVFIASAVLLIIRFVVLVFIMIFSPILFAGTIFPQTQSFVSDLWHKLFSYSFYAPVYILLSLISIDVLRSLNLGESSNGFASALATPPTSTDSFDVILKFAVAIGLMVGSLLVSQKMGVAGGKLAVGVGNNLRGRVQSFAGRKTIGKGSHYLREKYEEYDARAQKSTSIRGKIFRGTQKLVGAVGIDDRAITGTLEAGEHTKFGGSYSYEDDHKYDEKRKARQASTNKLFDFKKSVAGAVTDGKLKDFGEDTEAKIKFERDVADAGIKNLEELTQEQRVALVSVLSQNQFDALEKSEKLTDDEKKEIAGARRATLTTLYEKNREKITKASVNQLTALGATYLEESENAVRLTSSQIDDLKKELTATEFEMVSKARENALISLATNPIETTEGGVTKRLDGNFVLNQKPGEVAKMPAKVLIAHAPKLSLAVLEKIWRDATLGTQDQAKIRVAIEEALDGYTAGSPEMQFSPDEQNNLNRIVDWLDNNQMGRNFGK